MRKPDGVAWASGVEVKRNICEKICLYTECAGITLDILLDRCGMERSLKTKIANCSWKTMTFLQVLQICEALNIRYEDVFETKDEQVYRNVFRDRKLCEVISHKISEKKRSRRFVANELCIGENNFRNWLNRGLIPNPTVLSNILAYLNIKACDVKNWNTPKKVEVVKEEVKEEPKQEVKVDVMDEVIKAVSLYKNIKQYVAELDEIIVKAQKLRELLGGIENGETAGKSA